VIFEAHTSTLRDYYEAIDLLVLPSRSEGLPNVLLEAASFRVPVVAADVGAVGQVITGSADGWIVPPNNEQSLAVAIAEAVRNPQLRRTFAEAAKKRVSEQFGASARAERICEIYGELLS
jgi:glycosyltransferase involved in cell wall biosynthesis